MLHSAENSLGSSQAAWLNDQRDKSILHYGERVRISLAEPMAHLVLKSERAAAKRQQALHFGPQDGSDCIWQVIQESTHSFLSKSLMSTAYVKRTAL